MEETRRPEYEHQTREVFMLGIADIIPGDFRGCLSVTKEGAVIARISQGYADLANQVPNKANTRFGTASAGKAFVAVGIMQLIEQGKLRFDSTIGELLDLDLKQIDPQITVEQLLNHTSGIPDYFDESVMDEYEELWVDYPNYRVRESADLLPLFIDKPMMYPRGAKFQYNNTGFVVLGLIIEKIAGVMPFDSYLKEHVFGPGGMPDTGYFELDRLPARCANAYIFDENRSEYYTNIYSVDVKGTGAGGAFTTIPDVENFWTALLGGRLIAPEMVQKMISIQSQSEDDKDFYGYGIWLAKGNDGRLLPFFQGSDPGISFISSYDVTKKLCVTIVSNYGDNVWRLWRKIQNECA